MRMGYNSYKASGELERIVKEKYLTSGENGLILKWYQNDIMPKTKDHISSLDISHLDIVLKVKNFEYFNFLNKKAVLCNLHN